MFEDCIVSGVFIYTCQVRVFSIKTVTIAFRMAHRLFDNYGNLHTHDTAVSERINASL